MAEGCGMKRHLARQATWGWLLVTVLFIAPPTDLVARAVGATAALIATVQNFRAYLEERES